MIRIHRTAEPASLKPVREKKLPAAADAYAAGTFDRDIHIKGYAVVKEDLWNCQLHKCCYCEIVQEMSRSAVEHFRPAGRAQRGHGFPDYGYWWLAWTWENLFFVCNNCNSSAKLDHFPLESHSVPLPPETDPSAGNEHPLLIDPATENPLDHIQFRPVNELGKVRWSLVRRGTSDKGDWTIKVLKLNRPELLTLYSNHVQDYILEDVDRLTLARAAKDRDRVQDIWNHNLLPLTRPNRPFTALSYDALDHFVPQRIRRSWGLSFPQPR